MVDPDGELFIKPCTQKEIDFYNSANQTFPLFADLMPTFYGELSLSDATHADLLEKGLSEIKAQAGHPTYPADALRSPTAAEQANTPPAVQISNGAWIPNNHNPIKTDLSIVLENGTARFRKPNILDAKLGSRLWADDAPAEKKRRFDKVSATSTSGSHGFRIAGMKVYRGADQNAELDEEEYRVYDKEYGRATVTKDTIVDAVRQFLHSPGAGFDKPLSQAIASGFLRELRHVEEVLSQHESRMYSASLLFIYEGDGPALRAAIEENNKLLDSLPDANAGTARSTPRLDSCISVSDDESDSDELELPKILSLKLIDFAHAQWTPGQGPDENVLQGVRNLITIFEQLANES
jgi:1D-myo-inositol-tetrakisphosphate 5-kinase/inositol-polyphosphate multikinase